MVYAKNDLSELYVPVWKLLRRRFTLYLRDD